MQDPTLWLSLRSWSWQPLILLGLGLAAAAYSYAFYHFRRRGLMQAMVQQGLLRRSQPWLFAAGLATLLVALLSPINVLSEVLFSMHMVQHILLVMVAAPLILLGLPAPLLQPLVREARLKRILAQLTNPIVAFTLYNVALVGWHLPVLYEATLQSEIIHDAEHAAFFYTALLSWWPLLSPLRELPRLSYPAQMLYIFVMAVPAGILGAVIVFAERVFYPSYAAAPRLWGLTALADQQLGGLIMIIPSKLIYLIVLTVVFLIWFNQDEPATREQLL